VELSLDEDSIDYRVNRQITEKKRMARDFKVCASWIVVSETHVSIRTCACDHVLGITSHFGLPSDEAMPDGLE
jgi:hypothetical protein